MLILNILLVDYTYSRERYQSGRHRLHLSLEPLIHYCEIVKIAVGVLYSVIGT